MISISLRVGLGRAVRRLRKKKGFGSQERFAMRAGIARAYFSGVEQGKHNLSLDLIERIASALGIDTGELMTEAERDRKAKPISHD